MHSIVRAGKASFTSLAAITVLSLSGLALSSAATQEPKPQDPKPQQPKPQDPKSQEPKIEPKIQDASKTSPTAQATPQAVTKALGDLRDAVRMELEKSAFLQGKGVDMASLIITTGNAANAIAGAPASGGTLPGGGLGGDRNPPPDPNRPDPTKPGAGAPGQGVDALGEQQIVGVVMLVGSFRPRLDMKAQPAESSFRGDVAGGTYTVRRAGSSPMVQLVDSNDRTVATVPIIGFQDKEMGGDASTVPGDMRSNNRGDWGRIYLSILHFFQPDMG
jgi:hypothetical protein